MRRTTPPAKKWMTALLAVVAVSGYLLVSGALDPVLTEAISLALGNDDPSGAPADHSLRVKKVADWQYFDDRPEWSSVRGVPQVPGPADPVNPVRPEIAPPENPIHFIFTGPPPMPHYKLKPLSSCPQQHGPDSAVEQFTVTAGLGQATATWWDLGDPDTQSYQLIAEPNYINVGNGTRTVVRPLPVTLAVASPKACRQMTATITGLTSGRSYFFVLEATNLSPVQNRSYAITRAESGSYTIA